MSLCSIIVLLFCPHIFAAELSFNDPPPAFNSTDISLPEASSNYTPSEINALQKKFVSENSAQESGQLLPADSNSQKYFHDNSAPAAGGGAVGINSQNPQNEKKTLSSTESFFSSSGVASKMQGGGQHRVTVIKVKLHQFGYDFFMHGGFNPDSQSLVGPDYVIGPGDSMEIDIWGNIEGNYSVLVDRNGKITLPRIGTINLWGQTFSQAKKSIRKKIEKYFKNFELNVTMGGLRSIQVFLVGEVRSPGTYQISSLSTLVTALSAVGGPAKSGSLRKIQVLRNGHLVKTIDLYDFFLHGDKSADMRLQSGDTIFVPIAGAMVGVAGKVRRPAIYELKGGETVQDILTLAGGVVPTAYLQKVQVTRIVAHQSRVIMDLDLHQSATALAVSVQDRDLIKVTSIAFDGGYVSLEGYAARPGDYQLAPGMRLSDLLLTYDNLLPEFYPEVAQIIRMNPPEYRPEIFTVNLGRALRGDPEHNIELKEYDKVKIFSRQEMEERPVVSVSGAVLKAGEYRLYDKMTIKDLLTAAGNLKRTAYLSGAELTRYLKVGKETQTLRMTIDLGKVLVGDPKENIFLRPYDQLSVKAVQDLAVPRTVKIAGEVLLPGTYTVEKGERLSSVLTRAGGFVSGAYLRGAIFTRESAKTTQKLRLEKLIFEQEQEIARVSADIAAGAFTPEEAESAQTVLTNRMAAVEKLKRIPVTGRTIIHLSSLEDFSDSQYDLEVMPGDTLIIPENPMTVSVLGQVFNPVSLAFRDGETVSDYLSRVGGPTENANTDQIFIVRADGTVFSKEQSGAALKWDSDDHQWIVGSFNSAQLYPGDAILVPEKIDKAQWMRTTMDISTIFYQMALGAAAVASF